MTPDKSPDKYFVWRRSDGYVSSTANRMPGGWRTSSGENVTFEELGCYSLWSEAYDRIEEERSNAVNKS